MTYETLHPIRILALDPTPQGFGFVVLEADPLLLVDWGVATARRGSDTSLRAVLRLISRYTPTTLVIEDWTAAAPARRPALEDFMNGIADLIVNAVVHVTTYSRHEVRRAFAEARAYSKQDIALILAGRFPELAPRVPRQRKIWESEDRRMAIFDALGLAVVHLYGAGRGHTPNGH